MAVAVRRRRNKRGGFNTQIQLIEGRFDKRRTLSLPSRYLQNQVSEIVIYIKDILDARFTGRPIKPTTDAFLKSMCDDLRARFRKVGLLDESNEILTLQELWDRMLKVRKISPTTLTLYEHTWKLVDAYFKGHSPTSSVTLERARKWQSWMSENGKLKESTITMHTARLKAIFKDAFECELIDSNPIDHLKGLGFCPPDIEYLPIADFKQVLACVDDTEFAALFTVCRKIGLRIPSEITELRWSDVDNDIIRITDQKNRRHRGKVTRAVPLFPVIRDALKVLKKEVNPSQGDLVFPNYQTSQTATASLQKATKKAGLLPWRKPWNLLRESADQDLCDKYPEAVVAKWLGHNVTVSRDRYRAPNQNHQMLAMDDTGF